ncbi:hypothetical protein [Streptomyces radicis]|uniref:Secreted protein n=1 Tax=Streptomyces radicis TaxID=1750517 RepID=A0A3A9W757_9ACTN|nr:hypothetical protein [Streptomyces radicis]RKN08700.1 hypothetical protein D7319_15035 [Streptomyces radicis]RKN21858.1 hypothetical protein D7318_15990 [Streptomyces radicis]
MSAISVILLAATGTALALGAVALRTTRHLRAELATLTGELAERAAADEARPERAEIPAQEIRRAVAEALADERERELAEARAYWAEQEAREHEGPGALLAGRGLGYEVADADEELLDALLERYLLSDSGYPAGERGEPEAGSGESPELAAARRRHPSHPGFTLSGEPVERGDAEEYRRTADRLARLADAHTPLADVRRGPLGTLDIFLFADGTTLCLSPSHQEAAERLALAVREGDCPVLMGGSAVSGAFALTFSCGADSVYLLADRVVASSYLSE